MKLVIKVGGQGAEDSRVRGRVARQIAALCRAGHHVTVVHGGGATLTRTLLRLGIETVFHQGLRVTDAETRDTALMVLAGLVNKHWVAAIQFAGVPALGISGGDAGLVKVRKVTARHEGKKKDLGFVGRPSKVEPLILEAAFEHGIVPVVASLALGPGQHYFNVNADDLAAGLARALHADRLVFLTESGGVWDAGGKVIPYIGVSEIERLISRGVVKDGMIPKLRSCARTLAADVQEIDLISPARPGALLKLITRGRTSGTRIAKD